MALINALCTLADVKTMLGIATLDTTQDSKLELCINQVSAQISGYCGRGFGRQTYTETLSPTGRQLLSLQAYPVQSVTSITQAGTVLIEGTDYQVYPQYLAAGQVYREWGWQGQGIYRQVLASDLISARLDIEVVYVAGYYLPADALYVAGASNSLPLELSMVCSQMSAAQALTIDRGGMDGLTGLSQGGLAYTWGQAGKAGNNSQGILDRFAGVLNRYRKVVIAA